MVKNFGSRKIKKQKSKKEESSTVILSMTTVNSPSLPSSFYICLTIRKQSLLWEQMAGLLS